MMNPLQGIMDENRIIFDSMRVTARVLRENMRDAVTPRHIFRTMDVKTSLDRLKHAEAALSDLVVLSLVATFERTLRDHVKRRATALVEADDPVRRAIHAEILQDIEFWRISDRLIGVFRDRVEPGLLGQIKQIVGFRNWVAHGRSTAEPRDGNILPTYAFDQLTQFLTQAGIVEPP